MEHVVVVLNLFVMLLGLSGATYSRNATKVELTPKILDFINAAPELREKYAQELLNAEKAAGKQNTSAAIWAFASIALAGFTAALGTWPH